MDRPDLLAPPKLTARRYAQIVAGSGAVILLVGLALTFADVILPRQFAFKALIIILACAAGVWLYARFMRCAHRARPERMPVIHAISGLAIPAPLYISIFLLLSGTPLASATQSLLLWLPMMFGAGLAAAGFTRRIGDSMHCPHCEYEFKFENPMDAPIRCPECGNAWLGLLKKGRRVKSPRLIVLGVIIIVAGMLLFSPIFYMGKLAPHLPTSMLYAAIVMSPKEAGYAVWDELGTRTVSPQWTKRFAERVLQRRAVDQWDTGATGWFESAQSKNAVPPDMVERFYREGFAAELQAPRRAKAGTPFTVNIRVSRANSGRTNQLGVMFGGYTVADDPSPKSRRNATLWGHDLRPQTLVRTRDILPQSVTIDHPGDIRIRATYWVVYLPSFTEALQWQPDGTPARPPMALWFQRFDSEQVVRIE